MAQFELLLYWRMTYLALFELRESDTAVLGQPAQYIAPAPPDSAAMESLLPRKAAKQR
jgi:hypothetical protein